MNRQSVASSNINSIGYDPKTKTLEVEFSSGGIYHYHNVDPEHYENLMSADSVGSYFHKNIKGSHKYSQKK